MGRKSQIYGDQEWLQNFGKRFAKLRTHLELSQENMGKKLNVTRQRICQIESGNGKYPISILLFYDVCRIFRVNPNYLLGIPGKKKTKGDSKQ